MTSPTTLTCTRHGSRRSPAATRSRSSRLSTASEPPLRWKADGLESVDGRTGEDSAPDWVTPWDRG